LLAAPPPPAIIRPSPPGLKRPRSGTIQ
jgi:hypothetical protein